MNSSAIKVDEPVHDIAFAPSAGRCYHLLAVAAKDVSIFKFIEIEKKNDTHGDHTGNGQPTVYEIQLVEILENPSPSYADVNVRFF